MTGSPVYGLTKIFLAFLPAAIVPIMYSYFKSGPIHRSDNGLAYLHVYGLIVLLCGLVNNANYFHFAIIFLIWLLAIFFLARDLHDGKNLQKRT